MHIGRTISWKCGPELVLDVVSYYLCFQVYGISKRDKILYRKGVNGNPLGSEWVRLEGLPAEIEGTGE